MFRAHEWPINAYLETTRAEYRAAGKDVEFLPFYYNAEFVPLNISVTTNVVNTCDHDSDFIIFQSMQTCFNVATGAIIASPNCLVRITQEVGGRRLEDRDTHLINIFGRAQRPFLWPRPLRVPAKSSWTTTVTSLDAANNLNLRLTYGGVKAVPLVMR